MQRKEEVFEQKRLELETWLQRMESRLASMVPIGHTADVLEAQLREQKALHAELHQFKGQVEAFQQLMQRIIASRQNEDTGRFKKVVEYVNQHYARIDSCVINRGKLLHSALSSLQNLDRSMDNFLGWLSEAESVLESLETEPESRRGAQQLKELQNDIDLQSNTHAALRSSSMALLGSLAPEDALMLQLRGDEMERRWQMPKYQRKTEKAQWTADTMMRAIKFVNDGGSIRQAGRRFNIPESSIRKRKKAYDNGLDVVGPHIGKYCVLSPVQEKVLKDYIIKLAKLYYGITKVQLRKLAFSFAERSQIKHNFNVELKMAGKDWYYGFLKRNPHVPLRKPEATSINRITAFNKDQVSIFFQNLKKLYDKFKFKENAIFNVDETGISTVQKPCKRLGPKGVKQFGAMTSGERGKAVTVICCFNASGTCYVPPMFIFPRIRMTNTLTNNGPFNAIYSCSKSGWSNEEIFYKWVKHFKKTVKASQDDPVLLLLDNHSSHISLPIFDYCKENGIIILTIPPHTSHRLQPLDVSFYGPLKSAFNRQCDYHLTSAERITQYDLSAIFNKSYTLVATMDKAQSGFRACGIWPYQPDKFTVEDFLPATRLFPIVIDDELPFTSSSQKLLTEQNNSNSLPSTENSDGPVPSTSVPSTAKRQNRNKQKSEILTNTPNREKLEEKSKKGKTIIKGSKGLIRNSTKRKVLEETSESEDISESELYNDDELDDLEWGENEICYICEKGSIKNEMWFKCSVCKKWAHALCTGQDTPEGYICDFCDT